MPPRNPLITLLQRLVAVRDEEVGTLLWSAAYSFCLLSSYYILRPLRDEIGAQQRDDLSALWTAAFFVMLVAVPLYAVLVGRLPRRRFIPLVYRIFGACILAFFVLLHLMPKSANVWTERAFYVWASVFSLFVVSVFWGFMADIFRSEQAHRLFGFIAVGGTVGAMAGSGATALLVEAIDKVNLLPVSIVLLEAACLCVRRLDLRCPPRAPAASTTAARPAPGANDPTIGATPTATGRPDDPPPAAPARAQEPLLRGSTMGDLVRGLLSPLLLGIAAYVFLLSLANTILYFTQSEIAGTLIADRDERTSFLASIDFMTNVVVLVTQGVITGRIMTRLGAGPTLTIFPLLCGVSFAALAAAPVTATLVIAQVVCRGARYALAKPARELLFTVAPRRDKYKGKAFIDTVIYRGSDTVNAWLYKGLQVIGLTTAAIALTAVPIAIVWVALALHLGRRQREMAEAEGKMLCKQCGYDLRGHIGLSRCPECAAPIDLDEPT